MPKIDKLFTLEITPERFLNACSSEELMELEILMCSPAIQKRMNLDKVPTPIEYPQPPEPCTDIK